MSLSWPLPTPLSEDVEWTEKKTVEMGEMEDVGEEEGASSGAVSSLALNFASEVSSAGYSSTAGLSGSSYTVKRCTQVNDTSNKGATRVFEQSVHNSSQHLRHTITSCLRLGCRIEGVVIWSNDLEKVDRVGGRSRRIFCLNVSIICFGPTSFFSSERFTR